MSRDTISKRTATRKRNAEKRKRRAARYLKQRLNGSEGPQIAARARLQVDGSNSDEAVRRRILWFAHEHKLPPAEIEKAMTCRVDHIGAFAMRHEINLHWLLEGDLKDLRRMPMKQHPSIFTATDVFKLYGVLTMEQRRQITLTLATLVQANAEHETPAPIA